MSLGVMSEEGPFKMHKFNYTNPRTQYRSTRTQPKNQKDSSIFKYYYFSRPKHETDEIYMSWVTTC